MFRYYKMILPTGEQKLSVKSIVRMNNGKFKRKTIFKILHSDPNYALCEPLEVGSNKKTINVWKLSEASTFIVL